MNGRMHQVLSCYSSTDKHRRLRSGLKDDGTTIHAGQLKSQVYGAMDDLGNAAIETCWIRLHTLHSITARLKCARIVGFGDILATAGELCPSTKFKTRDPQTVEYRAANQQKEIASSRTFSW